MRSTASILMMCAVAICFLAASQLAPNSAPEDVVTPPNPQPKPATIRQLADSDLVHMLGQILILSGGKTTVNPIMLRGTIQAMAIEFSLDQRQVASILELKDDTGIAIVRFGPFDRSTPFGTFAVGQKVTVVGYFYAVVSCQDQIVQSQCHLLGLSAPGRIPEIATYGDGSVQIEAGMSQ